MYKTVYTVFENFEWNKDTDTTCLSILLAEYTKMLVANSKISCYSILSRVIEVSIVRHGSIPRKQHVLLQTIYLVWTYYELKVVKDTMGHSLAFKTTQKPVTTRIFLF